MKRKLLIVWAITAGLFLPQSAQSANSRNVVITLERTMCFGTCPVYRLTVYGDGKVVYEGEDFVKVKGMRITRIAPEKVTDLVQNFYKIRFLSLQDEYTGNVTDLPTTITSITINGRHKKVSDRYGAPEALIRLEKKIDEIAGSKQWVGK